MSLSATSGHASVSRAGKTHITLDPAGPHNPPIPKFGCGMGREGMTRTEREGMEGIEGAERDGKDREEIIKSKRWEGMGKDLKG